MGLLDICGNSNLVNFGRIEVESVADSKAMEGKFQGRKPVGFVQKVVVRLIFESFGARRTHPHITSSAGAWCA